MLGSSNEFLKDLSKGKGSMHNIFVGERPALGMFLVWLSDNHLISSTASMLRNKNQENNKALIDYTEQDDLASLVNAAKSSANTEAKALANIKSKGKGKAQSKTQPRTRARVRPETRMTQ